MTSHHKTELMHYTLRIASAMCFIGHGAFGIITKEIWCNYFAVFGIGHDLAYRLMPIMGSVDIMLGISLLIYPVYAVAGWLVVWGIFTAALRPLSGEPFPEFIERAGNFGAPVALLLLSGSLPINIKGWFTLISTVTNPNDKIMKQLAICLSIVAFLLLLGHGWLNVMEKKGLVAQYTGLGFSNPAATAHSVGMFELIAAASVLIRPSRPLLVAFLVWKAGSELFYPHYEIYEWMERGGSYGTILALWLCLEKIPANNASPAINQIKLF